MDAQRPRKPLPSVPPIGPEPGARRSLADSEGVQYIDAAGSSEGLPTAMTRSGDDARVNSASSPRNFGILLGQARNSPVVRRKTFERNEQAQPRRADSESVVKPKSGFDSVRRKPLGPPMNSPFLPDPEGVDRHASGGRSPRSNKGSPMGSPRGDETAAKSFLRDLAQAKAEIDEKRMKRNGSSQLGGTAHPNASVSSPVISSPHITLSTSQGVIPMAHHHSSSGPPIQISPREEFDPHDTVATLREKMEIQKARYEKWRKDHMDDTRMKLSALSDEIKRLHDLNADLTRQNEHLSNELKESAKAAAAFEEEKQRLVKKIAEDQKKMEKLLRGKKSKPQGLPKDVVRSGIFGRTTTSSNPAASMVVKTNVPAGPAISEPKLIKHTTHNKLDSTPVVISVAGPQNRIRTPADFDLVALIGQGGFGAVFLCREVQGGKVCAVKRMAKSAIVKKEQVHTVNVEVGVLKEARMEHSPWIVQLFYAFSDKNYIYLAMEFCAGGDLRNLIDNVELEEEGVRFLTAEMIVSVNALHERGYVHRDLKPSNFLIASSGHLKLADFGLSKSGFTQKKATMTSGAQVMRFFLVDEAYKTLMINSETTVSEVMKQLKVKLRIPKNAPWLIYENNTIGGLNRERPMAMDEKPLKVCEAWQKGLVYKFVFKEADSSRVQAMSRARVEVTHSDPFFQEKTKVQARRERLYSVVGSPHYMAAEILEGSGYDAVVDWWSMGCILYEMLVGAPPFTGSTAEEVFASVLNSKDSLKFPSKEEKDISDNAKDLVKRFLCRPNERIGYNGVGEIKAHPFFEGLSWTTLHMNTPPFEPSVDDEFDCGYFESATTEGIENMRMNDPPEGEDPIAEDPWKDGWDWSCSEKELGRESGRESGREK